MKPATLLTLLTLCAGSLLTAAPVTVQVDVAHPGPAISPVMHGVFFEDINYAADGGLYAELVQNRSFEFADPDGLFAWDKVARDGAQLELTLETEHPIHPNNPRFLRLAIGQPGRGAGLVNSGFDGIAVRQGEPYRFSVHARTLGGRTGSLAVRLLDPAGQAIGSARVENIAGDWRRYEAVLEAGSPEAQARLEVTFDQAGTVDLDMVSLFPVNTWKQRRNGVRADLAGLLAQMQPGFVRFPGGCIVEGKDLANAYRWKDTIGDVAERRQNWNRWQDAIRPDHAPQYYQSYGLGFFEFFQLCEDIGSEAVPILNCGMACQYQSRELVPLDELGPWVQDALDLIEFANGPADSPWGSKRAAMGHPEPFRLKYLGIGNEQWGEEYFERYPIFERAIRDRYPEIHLITTSGPGVDDRAWNLAWGKFRRGMPAEIVDEHYYRPPEWFLQHSDRYDGYDREGPKVFAGEFAAHGPGRRNSLYGAITEAAFMTGLIRNADVVVMSAYAPLLAKVGWTQWTPDLIWFDNQQVYGTPSYYVQQLFSIHRGDAVLPTTVQGPGAADTPSGLVGVGTWNTQAEFKDIRVTQGGRTLLASDFSAGTQGWKLSRGNWEIVDGALRQTGRASGATAVIGETSWRDYTLSLKARKLSGAEGFLVLFHSPGDATKTWWNVGGWGNSQHILEAPGVTADGVRGSIETNRWYDLRIDLEGPKVRCYLDDRLVQEVTRKPVPNLYAVATLDRSGGDVVLKVVNVTARPIQAEIDLQGAGRVAADAQAVVLTSASPEDENSLAEPTKVAPVTHAIQGVSPLFNHAFPAHSMTVLRVRTQ